jgi:hypothetical protein
MKKEVKIEDFISSSELESMTEKEREIYNSVFQLKKKELQGYTDALELIKEFKNKHNDNKE